MYIQTNLIQSPARTVTGQPKLSSVKELPQPKDHWEPSNRLESVAAYGVPLVTALAGAATGLTPFFSDNLAIQLAGPVLGMAATGALLGTMFAESDDPDESGKLPYLRNALVGAAAGALAGAGLAGSPAPILATGFGGFMAGVGGVVYFTEGFGDQAAASA